MMVSIKERGGAALFPLSLSLISGMPSESASIVSERRRYA